MKRWLWLALLVAVPAHAQELRVEGGDAVLTIIPDTVYVEVPGLPPPWECPDGWTCTPPPEPLGPTIYATQTAANADRIQEREPGPDTLTAGNWYFRVDLPEWVDLGIGYDGGSAPDVTNVRMCRPSGACNTESLWPYELNPRVETVSPGEVTITGTINWTDGTSSEVSRTFTVNPNEPPAPPDTTPPEPGAPDSIRFVPMSPGDTINYWVTGYWDDLPYTAWLKVSVSDSVGTADLWQAYDPVGDCQYVEGPWVEQFVNVTEVTGSKFDPSFLFFPRYCGPPPEPPDTIAISTPQNLRTEDGNMIAGIAWDRVPEDGQCENATGHPANCSDVQGDEIYYRVTDVEYWPADLMETAGYSSTLMFDTLSAMASTHRSFKLRYPGPGDVIPDSLRFCVTAEAWDCPTCAGPGGVRSPGNLRGYNPVYYVPISEKACSGMLEVTP